MAILLIVRGDGFTKELYENARKEVNWEGNHPSGGMFHAASFDKSGNTCVVADIWESEEQWNNFLNTRLKPFFEKAKAPPVKTEIYQIHNINAFPAIDNYKVR